MRLFVQRLFIFPLCHQNDDQVTFSPYQRTCVQNLLQLATTDVKNSPQYVEQYFGTFDILLKLPSYPPLSRLLLELGALNDLLHLALESERIFRHTRAQSFSKLFRVVATLTKHCDLSMHTSQQG